MTYSNETDIVPYYDYDINYNYPFDYSYIDRKFKNDKPSFEDSYTKSFLSNKLTRDGLYYIFDSRKKQEFNRDYLKNTAKDYVGDYAKSKVWGRIFKKSANILVKKLLH